MELGKETREVKVHVDNLTKRSAICWCWIRSPLTSIRASCCAW